MAYRKTPGPGCNIKMVSSYLISIWATPMLQERRPVGRFFFNTGLSIPYRLYIETGPRGSALLLKLSGAPVSNDIPVVLLYAEKNFTGDKNITSHITFDYSLYFREATQLIQTDN